MNGTRLPSSNTLRPRATTLVEVVAGLALLAALLAGIVQVKARYTRQARLTAQRREAVRAADALLSAWWHDAGPFPRAANGLVPENSELAWRTRPTANASARAMGAQVIRLEIRPAGSDEDTAPLAGVEVVIADRTKP